ncbi:hypothetical protein HY031_01570 [Candidatus Gottesmanbacteria bacterium]|nr:hypothetical protein [Candidatus Gottesmanbacteria bacterium]
MGRTKVTPMYQPGDDPACGAAALKHALAILGKRKSLKSLKEVCKITRNGTSTTSMIHAINRLGLSTVVIKSATLHHLHSALRYRSNNVRAVIVSYLYDVDENEKPQPDSGHWATVSSYLSSKSRIVLFDSIKGQKKSYLWQEFRNRWVDYDLKRRKVGKRGNRYKIVRHWQPQLMMIVAKETENLPQFSIGTAKTYPAN